MGTNTKTTPRRGEALGDSDEDRWCRGEECGLFNFQNESVLRKVWESNRDDIVSDHVNESPGTRPERWWDFSAPRLSLKTHSGYHEVPTPRKRLGGIGTPDFEVLNYKPYFSFGVPVSWVTQSNCDYYNRVGLFAGVVPNPRSDGPFEGVAINKDDPPIYESEASYLDRHGLFLPGEKRRLKKADFEPETLAYVDDD